jgi:hypothetical protein
MERVVLPVGTEVAVRTNERIDSRDVVEGQTFSAQIEEDIRDTDGSVAIPRGSDVRLVTRRVEVNGDITLDVDSITMAGRRYRVSTSMKSCKIAKPASEAMRVPANMLAAERCSARSSVRLQAVEKVRRSALLRARVPALLHRSSLEAKKSTCRRNQSYASGWTVL